MIISDGSHVVEMPKDSKMVSIKVHYECFAEICVFADDVDTVKEFARGREVRMPLPFKGQDGSQNLILKSVMVGGEELVKGGG